MAALPASVEEGAPREDSDLPDVAAAIELVLRGQATRVVVSGLRSPRLAAGLGAARARLMGVGFDIATDPLTGSVAITVGPRL